MAVTLADLDTMFLSLINEDDYNSRTYPPATRTLMLNNAQRKICSGSVINYETKQMIPKWPLPFLDRAQPYMWADDISTTVTTTIGATSITTSASTSFPSSGYLWVMGNIISYSGNTWTGFTGIPATGDLSIKYPYTAGTDIKIAFLAPTDYGELVRMVYNNSMLITPKDHRNIWMNAQDPRWANYSSQPNFAFTSAAQSTAIFAPSFYSIINAQYLVCFNIGWNTTHFLLLYEKEPETMTASVWPVIPDKWSLDTIPLVAVAEMLFLKGEEERAIDIMDRLAYPNILSMYEYYQNTAGEMINNQSIQGEVNQGLSI